MARVGADRVTIFDVDAVAAPLRELLIEERAALLDDVEYLRRCLEEEAEIGRRVRAPPPDVTELRNYGAKLRGAVAVLRGTEALRVRKRVSPGALLLVAAASVSVAAATPRLARQNYSGAATRDRSERHRGAATRGPRGRPRGV